MVNETLLIKACPADFDNMSNISSLTHVIAYCAFSKHMVTITSAINITFCFVGVIGGILSLINLIKNKVFPEPCFICYQTLAATQLNYSIIKCTKYLFPLNGNLQRFYFWSYWRFILSEFLTFVISDADSVIIAFLSLQIFLACSSPRIFQYTNRTSVYVAVIIFGYIFFSLPAYTPFLFSYEIYWRNDVNEYVWRYHKLQLYKVEIYWAFIRIFMLTNAAIAIISSLMAIVGATKAVIRRYTFYSDKSVA